MEQGAEPEQQQGKRDGYGRVIPVHPAKLRVAAEIGHAGHCVSVAQIVSADGEDSTIIYRNRLPDRESVVNGYDLAIAEDQVGRLAVRLSLQPWQ